MGVRDFFSTLRHVPVLLDLKKALAPQPDATIGCLGAWVERNAAEFGQRSAIVFEDREVNWDGFNALANRYAHFLLEQGLARGDSVSICMENRIEFLALVVAANKLGIIASLINTNLSGRPLVHCISVTRSKKCIFGTEVAAAIEGARSELALVEGRDYYAIPDGDAAVAHNWAQDMHASSSACNEANPPDTQQTTIGETAFHVFTSGTTGLPKAAILSNRRYLGGAGMSARAGLYLTPEDRIYLCLPLYHATGLLVGAGAAFASGASMFVRRKFSASRFLSDVRTHHCTGMIYIGELCRYLVNTPRQPDDHINPLRAMIGNGMRPDVWMDFKTRFGVARISEFYGASEGNVSFANLLNKDCTVGMTASEVVLVKYDVDADEIVRDGAGRCIPVAHGEPGLMLGKITESTRFEGYTDPEATEKKIVRDALEPGDAWFNSGDLMRTVDVGFSLGYDHYQFVDRVGDTFRWKSENVSTNEVGEIINGFEDIDFCNVYGVEVPGTDGRAGMAAVTLNPGVEALDPSAFAEFVRRELPAYAVPLFVRVQKELDVTGTFKMVKGDLRREGYDIDRITDPVYVMKAGQTTYVPLDHDYLERIRAAQAGY